MRCYMITAIKVLYYTTGLCCYIAGIKSPFGNTDDSISKYNADFANNMVNQCSCKWRYQLNDQKGSVLVYVKKSKSDLKIVRHRLFRLGTEKIHEKCLYDHVGLKNCMGENYSEGTEEQIRK